MADTFTHKLNLAPSGKATSGRPVNVPVVAADLPPVDLSMESLAAFITRTFNEFADHRQTSGRDDILLKCLRLSKSEYSSAELAVLSSKGAPAVFAPISDTKRRAALALISEIFTNPGDKPWTLRPTPVVDIPSFVKERAVGQTMADFKEYAMKTGIVPNPEACFYYVQDRIDEISNQEEEWAKVRAERMEKKIHDQMIEGGWLEAFGDYCNYLCTYGTAVIKGPVPRMRRKKRYVNSSYGFECEMGDEVVLEYEAVSPWDCFPAPGSKNIMSGAFCQRVHFTPADLRGYSKKRDGLWNKRSVRSILDMRPDGGIHIDIPTDIERRRLEGGGTDNGTDCTIDGIEYFGEVRGSQLIDLGITHTQKGEVLDEEDYYEVDAIVISGSVVYCKICDMEIGRPLSKGTFYKVPDAWWGDSLIEKMENTQKICNAAVRDLVVNMAQASGPQTVIKDIGRLHPSCSPSQSPWKVWIFQNAPMGSSDNPMHMFQPDSNARELLLVFDWGMKQADSDTGIPAYTYGSDGAAGAGRTSSGLAMLSEAATRGIRMVVQSSDIDVVRTTVKRTFDHNMLYSDDESIKGDCEVNPAGVMSIILKEQSSIRRQRFLQMSNNPVDNQIISASGRAAVWREELKGLDVNPDDVLPSKAKLREIDEIIRARQAIQDAQGEAALQTAQTQAQGDGMQQGAPEQPPSTLQRRNPMQGALRVRSQNQAMRQAPVPKQETMQ